jgi:capsular polysaccharide biosynthesis protein
MNLVDYGRILIRRGWIMILLGVIAAGAAFVFSRQLEPMYRATQKVLIIPSRSDFGLTEAARQILNNHVAYLDSSLRAAEVIDRLQMDTTPGQLRSDITIASDQLSLLIQIDADHKDPGEAVRIAAAWGDLLLEYRNELNQQARREDRIEARLQDNPVPFKASPNVPINTLVGLIAGIFVGGVIVFVLEYLESSIVRRREDIEISAGLTVLATVPSVD